MRIAVIGAGAMGSIYGGHLSLHHEVFLVDTNQAVIDRINDRGLALQEHGDDVIYYPKAVSSAAGLGQMDLVILFVKALYSKAALSSNREFIGDDTYVLTLQNGSGHEDILSEFVSDSHILIGTTEDNGAVLEPGYVRHGGEGKTNIGMLIPDESGILSRLKQVFDDCGFQLHIHEDIQRLIWEKLMTNVSLSAVTGVLQVKMGYITSNRHAWNLTERLVKEAVEVAAGLGLNFSEEEVLHNVRETSRNNPEGVTSICMDLANGRKTEVDTISGSVVKAARKCHVPAPTHEMMVALIHALEEKTR